MPHIHYASWESGSVTSSPVGLWSIPVEYPKIIFVSDNNQAFVDQIIALAKKQPWCAQTKITQPHGENFNITIMLNSAYKNCPPNARSSSTKIGGIKTAQLDLCRDWSDAAQLINEISRALPEPIQIQPSEATLPCP